MYQIYLFLHIYYPFIKRNKLKSNTKLQINNHRNIIGLRTINVHFQVQQPPPCEAAPSLPPEGPGIPPYPTFIP